MDTLGSLLSQLTSWATSKYGSLSAIPVTSRPQIILNSDGGGTIVCPTPKAPVGKAEWPFSGSDTPLTAIAGVVSTILSQ